MNVGGARIQRDENSPGYTTGERLFGAIRAFAAAVVQADGVDPMVTEAVRLRCAQVHDCRFCSSVRLREALQMGFDEEMNAKISRYETAGFDARIVAALRLCDAIILTPDSADEELSEELHRYFSDAQIAEICLDVIKWSEQKQLVALRLEEPPWDEPYVLYFDEDGMHRYGGPVSQAVSESPGMRGTASSAHSR